MTDPATTPERARERSWGLANAVLGVLVLALLAVTVAVLVRGPDVVPDQLVPAAKASSAEKELLAYAEVKAAAREWTTDFLRVDHENMDPIIKRVLAGTADPFKGQYEASRENLKQLAKANESVSTGEVIEVGVSELEGNEATLYVAANSEVKNKNTEKPQERFYRIELKMVREGGSWLTSGLTFVG